MCDALAAIAMTTYGLPRGAMLTHPLCDASSALACGPCEDVIAHVHESDQFRFFVGAKASPNRDIVVWYPFDK